jgi:putative transposon-encoded protein
MRQINIIKEKLTLQEDVELVFEKLVTPFGNSAKVDVQKKYIGKRAYVIIMKD